MLQGIIPYDMIPSGFVPRAIIYVAPVFRHTHFDGRQIVVHNRRAGLHELFSYNLYPGPSAKKGIYGMLLGLGEREGWVTNHCSTVQVITPYDNVVTIMHEGASGGGKSEMLEQAHREPDGRLLLGENLVTGERRYLEIPRSCALHAVTDDMALCHPSLQEGQGKLTLTDAENAWFVRVNHIEHYGTDVYLERLTAEPPVPLLFLSVDAVPGSRALIWEHIEDAPGKRCPNPRVIIPRNVFPNVVEGAVTVDIRSFGVRTPPCTKEKPTYGILGLFHILPPALAWLWRLISPRGHANPSIVDTEGMTSEGVGSYWPFATGRRVDQANLLLRQFTENTRMRHILCPNQHIGAWRVGFMPQWIAREYLARRGAATFRPEQLRPRLNFPPRYRRTRGPGVISLIGVDYLRLKTGDGGDLYLTRFGMPFREQLAPENWYAPDWFAVRRARLPGTSAIYKVPTRPVRGVSLNLVARFSRVGQEIPLDTLTLDENIHAEFNSPFEEFALVMELRAAGLGASRARILTKRPLAIYMPPEQLQHWQTGRLESKMAAKRARHPEAELDLLRQYILLYGWIDGLNAVQAIQALAVP